MSNCKDRMEFRSSLKKKQRRNKKLSRLNSLNRLFNKILNMMKKLLARIFQQIIPCVEIKMCSLVVLLERIR